MAAVGLIGAGLLLAAEFRPLYIVHVTTYGVGPTSVSTGSHDSFALVPIALLAAGLALVGLRGRALGGPALGAGGRQRTLAADAALTGLGVIALLITLLGDLPDTRARGITHDLTLASTTAGAGLYLETLGAVLLLGAGGAGLLSAAWASRPPRKRTRHGRPRGRRRETRVRRPSGESAS